ncbi:MAG: type IV pilus modification protein PilV [Pseudomonadota bacterium]|nr:type IV pilus modification protein PilV [Pseudomonadota bacterium]
MRRRGACGFTLAEVLVAVFVLAVGVIGAAAVQTMAAQTRHLSSQVSAALQLASALAERMAANPVQMALPDSDKVYLQDPGAPWVCSSACSPAQLAATERDDTASAVARAFPGGQVRVCRDLPSPSAPLTWACNPGADAPLVVKIGWRAPDLQPFAVVLVPEAS